MTNPNFQSLDMDYFKQIAERRNKRIEAERAEALRKKNEPKQEAQKEQEREAPRIIIPSEITNPQDYIILEGRTHESYSYPDTLIAKKRSHLGKNWNECQEAVKREGSYMPTIRQFVDFLSMLKSGKAYDGKGNKVDKKELERLFLDITEVKDPYRAEWLDAKFGKDAINYNFIRKDGLRTETGETLGNCLMKDKNPGIDLESWLKTADYHGLPTSKTKDGSLHYYYPREGYVAGFGADSVGAGLYCYGNPAYRDAGLGVRLARSEAPKQSQSFGGK